ncbi:MAG: SMR family transporter [Actinomycetota bacterium]|nr:SMR family transporter [Actinomycetota bacterium]
MAWILIAIAGLLEVGWAIALKESSGFSRLTPTLIFVPLYLLSAVLLGLALRSLPVGSGYAVWVGIGALGAAAAGILFFNESIAPARLIPLGLIAIGVIWLAAVETG